jgi:hypothetical protein
MVPLVEFKTSFPLHESYYYGKAQIPFLGLQYLNKFPTTCKLPQLHIMGLL